MGKKIYRRQSGRNTDNLKRYLEEDDSELLGSVKERLAVIQGVLTMVEQYGAAMLTEEMVSLCEFIAESNKNKEGQAIEVLLRAVLQLPDYLEHIQSGRSFLIISFDASLLLSSIDPSSLSSWCIDKSGRNKSFSENKS